MNTRPKSTPSTILRMVPLPQEEGSNILASCRNSVPDKNLWSSLLRELAAEGRLRECLCAPPLRSLLSMYMK